MIGLFAVDNPTIPEPPAPTISIVGSVVIEENDNTEFEKAISGLPLQDGDLGVLFTANDHVENRNFYIKNASSEKPMTKLYDSHASGVECVWAYRELLASDDYVGTGDKAYATAGVFVALRGANTTISASDYVWTNEGNNNSDPNPPAISVSDGDLVIVVGFIEDTHNRMTEPAGYTRIARAEAEEGGDGGDGDEDASICVAYKWMTSNGTENPGAFSVSGGNNTMALTWKVAAA